MKEAGLRSSFTLALQTLDDDTLNLMNRGVSISIGSQPPDIAQGVDSAHEARTGGPADELDRQGAGDQGMMFAYACESSWCGRNWPASSSTPRDSGCW